MSHTPFISIITVVYNGAAELPGCLSSVAEQTWSGVEHIVVDGGSTDGTLDVIRAQAAHLGWWVTEPDHGIYDAMNKGIAAARGGRRALAVDPGHFPARMGIRAMCMKVGRADCALHAGATLAFLQGDTARALGLWQQGLQANPKNPEIH